MHVSKLIAILQTMRQDAEVLISYTGDEGAARYSALTHHDIEPSHLYFSPDKRGFYAVPFKGAVEMDVVELQASR